MRSYLFVPADSERKLARGKASGADALLLDLEDSVAVENRAAARKLARAYLESEAAKPARYVRINPLSSGVALDDLVAVVPGAPDGIMLPKCTPDDVRTVDHYLSALELAAGLPVGKIRIVAIATETPQAVFTLGGYAGCSARLHGLTWGAEDLATCIGAHNRKPDGTYDDVFRLARSLCLLAASSAGVIPIDTVYTDFKNLSGLREECLAARRAGFLGKLAIHPDQVAVMNEAFSPTEAEIAWARTVKDAFAKNPGAGTIGIDGKMIDRPHLVLAERVLKQVRT